MSRYKKLRPGTDLTNAKAHRADHQAWSRRGFLKTLGLAGAAQLSMAHLPLTALAAAPLTLALQGGGPRKLVIIRLKGGNDGLNTFVPLYQFSNYQALRPTLAHSSGSLIELESSFAMPDSMQSLLSLWEGEQMRVINSVGYENQNLSHFTGSDIVFSGNDNVSENGSGWLARYFTNQNPDYLTNPCPFPPAVKIGGPTNVLFNSEDGIDISANFANTDQLNSLLNNAGVQFDNTTAPDDCYYGEQVLYLRSIANSAALYGTAIYDAYEASTTEADYGGTLLGQQLELVARLIKGGLETQFFLVTLDGFDTHASQNGVGNHLGLLQQFSDAVNAFYTDLAASSFDQDVLTMTGSEFGRRVQENGLSGTDHGTAAPVMLFGPALAGKGFHGENPDLTTLDGTGNLQIGTDFRSIYATVLDKWLCLDADLTDEILGNSYDRLDGLGFSCQTVGIEGVPDPVRTQDHRVYHLGGGTYRLVFQLPRATRIGISLFTIGGIPVLEIPARSYSTGKNTVDFDLSIAGTEILPMVYSLSGAGIQWSGKFLLNSL